MRFIEAGVPKQRRFTNEQLEIIKAYMGDAILEILNSPTSPVTEWYS